MSQAAQTAEKCDSPTACAHSVGSTEDAPLSRKSKSKVPLIGIDLLGGDHHSCAYVLDTLQGILQGIDGPCHFFVFTTSEIQEKVEAFKETHVSLLEEKQIHGICVNEVIHMDDDPLHAIRRKKESSLCVGVRLLKEKKLDALVSTGNTGALIAAANMYLPMLDGISRAALITLLPTKENPVAVIDVGANIHCKPEHLVQFAQMGLAYQKSRGIESPKVGLLNIGTEEKKGRADLRETYQLLQEFGSAFVGNVEGKRIFSGEIDVLVTDGFTGNVFLKTAEGISSFILDTLHENQHTLFFSKPLLNRLEKELYSAEYPGAILCGVEGIIIKCHGDAQPEALKNGVQGALNLISGSFLKKIKSELDL